MLDRRTAQISAVVAACAITDRVVIAVEQKAKMRIKYLVSIGSIS